MLTYTETDFQDLLNVSREIFTKNKNAGTIAAFLQACTQLNISNQVQWLTDMETLVIRDAQSIKDEQVISACLARQAAENEDERQNTTPINFTRVTQVNVKQLPTYRPHTLYCVEFSNDGNEWWNYCGYENELQAVSVAAKIKGKTILEYHKYH